MLLFYKSASSTCLCVDTSRKIRKQTSLKKFCWVIHILSDWSIARIFYFFMYWLNMSLQIHLLSRLMITLIARIFSFHLQTEYESSDFPVCVEAWWSHWLQEYLIWLCWPAQCTRPSRSWRTSLRARSSYPRTSKSSLRRLAGSGPVHIETGFSYNWKTLKNFVENYSHWLRGTSSCLRYASPVCERWVSACLWICIHMNCRDIWFTNDLTSNDG